MKTFLSYPSENLDLAWEVYDFVRTLGVQIWFDKESLIAGQNWDRERATAQKSADLIILICSSETINKSGVIQREIKDALDLLRDKPLSHIFLVSLRT
jgi:TIR domain